MKKNKITRLEVIDHTSTAENFGRAFVKWDDKMKIEFSYQDNDRTLKIFLSDNPMQKGINPMHGVDKMLKETDGR